MKYFVVLLGVLALLAMGQAQNEENEGSTVDPSDEGGNSSPSPPPPPPPSGRPRPPGHGLGPRPKPPHPNGSRPEVPPFGHRGNGNRPDRFPQPQPVVFDSSVGSRSNFGTGNHFGDQTPSNPSTEGV